jgi:hypothetical protein
LDFVSEWTYSKSIVILNTKHMSDLNSTGEVIKTHATLAITGIALSATFLFHILIPGHELGFGFALFSLALAIGMILIAHLEKSQKNIWAFLFLIPVLMGSVTHALYAGNPARVLSFLLALGSLTFFAYWYTRPKIRFKDVIIFWPRRFTIESLWPYPVLQTHLAKVKNDKKLGSIILGICISIPFLLIFAALFSSADHLFAKSFRYIFESAETEEWIIELLRDLFVGLFFLASGFMMFLRQKRSISDKAIRFWNWINETTLAAFLAMINFLFAVFTLFQAAYFFGGEELIKSQGITYADYARSGFFELLFVAGLVFAISLFIYRGTNMQQKLTRILTTALIVQTGIILFSAMSRLMIYIDAYGLTLSRFWAAFCIILIGLVLTAGAVGAMLKINYSQLAKVVFLGSLILTSTVMVFNIEGLIARYNIERYLSGKAQFLDIHYLNARLSSDAVPELVLLAKTNWPHDSIAASASNEYYSYDTTRDELYNFLDYDKSLLRNKMEKNVLGLSMADYWAMEALNSL